MEYNKHKFTKARDKKLLHKINKQWVVISLSLLATLGVKSLTSHPVSANVTGQNVNLNQKMNSNQKKSSNIKLVASNAENNQSKSNLQEGSLTYSDNNSIIHKANLLHQGIMKHALESSSTSASASASVSTQLSNTNKAKSQNESLQSRQLGNERPNLSNAPQSDVGEIKFQYMNQNNKLVGTPGVSTGKVVGSLVHLNASDVSKTDPVPEGYQLEPYYHQYGNDISSPFHPNQMVTFRVKGDRVDKLIPVYLHIQSDGQWITKEIPDYRFHFTGRIGDVIVRPNKFVKSDTYKDEFNGPQNEYHLDNSNDRDRDVYAQMSNGHFVPSHIDFYYVRSNRQIPNGMSMIKTYYYDRQDYDPNKSVAWNNQYALVPHSVKSDLMTTNQRFNYQSRQQNIPSGFYFVKDLNAAPQSFGSNGTVTNFRIEVAKNSRLIYRIPSENNKIVSQQTLTGFKTNDPLLPYVKSIPGYVKSGGPYTIQNGKPSIANTVNNGQTYYVDLIPSPIVTGHIIYHDVSDNIDVPVSNNQGEITVTGKKGDALNYQDYVHQIPAGFHLNSDNVTKNKDWQLNSDTDYTIDVDRNQGQITLNYVANNDQNNVLKTQTITGPVGSKFNDGPYTNNDYINGLLNGYHFDHEINSVNDYTNNPQTVFINVAKNQQPVPQSDASVELDYVDGGNNQVERQLTVSGVKGSQIPYDQYTSSAYIPQGYTFSNLGPHADTYVDGANGVIFVNKVANSQPTAPQTAAVELDYMTPSDGNVVNRRYSSGQVGTAIPYSQYTSSNDIPQGYSFAGLGQHANTFGNGNKVVILIRKNKANPQPQRSRARVQPSKKTSNEIPIPHKIKHHAKGAIKMVYVDPRGHVIKRKSYYGKSGKPFGLTEHQNLHGYRFNKLLLGSNTNRFDNHHQTVVMQMLPLSARHRHTVATRPTSAKDLMLAATTNARGHSRLGAEASYDNKNVTASSDPADSVSSKSGNGTLPQTGERQSVGMETLTGALLMISAILIAGYDFDVKRHRS